MKKKNEITTLTGSEGEGGWLQLFNFFEIFNGHFDKYLRTTKLKLTVNVELLQQNFEIFEFSPFYFTKNGNFQVLPYFIVLMVL